VRSHCPVEPQTRVGDLSLGGDPLDNVPTVLSHF
jgi:hypothetical protein